MAFRTYETLGEVLKKYQLTLETGPFPLPTGGQPAPVRLHNEIAFTLDCVPYDVSEAAICENLIYPVLREAWKLFVDVFSIWSHQPVALDEELCGIPDYVIARRSKLGKIVFDTPYVAVVEAKKDDFTGGWAQCSIEMYTIQQLNNDQKPVYGIVSNGEIWEIGLLDASTLRQYRDRFDINRLDELFSALTYVLETCKQIYNL